MSSKVIINKNKKTILKLDKVDVNVNIPKVDQILKLYFWKINNQNILPMNGVEINLKKIHINISMGDINAIQYFVNNDFDEKSPLYSEEEPIFNTMNLNVIINSKNDTNINI